MLRCLLCRRELRELAAAEICPDCGTPIAVSLEAAAADAGPNIDADLACRQCGYNLRGLPRAGCCPECGTAISFLHGNLLCLADPAYVGKLARGSVWILRGLTAVMLAAIGGIVTLGTFLSPAGPVAGDTWSGVVGILLGLTWLLGVFFCLAGVWLITTRQPLVFFAPPRDTARRLARSYLIVALPVFVLNAALEAATPPVWAMATGQVVGLAASVLCVVASVAYFLYLEGLAQRIPQRSLARRARGLAYGVGIALGLMVLTQSLQTVFFWGGALVPGTAAPAPATTAPIGVAAGPPVAFDWLLLAGCFMALDALVLLILFLVGVWLHYRMRKVLGQQATAAERLAGMVLPLSLIHI